MRTKDKYVLGSVAGILIFLVLLLPLRTGAIDIFWLDFIKFSIKQSWQEILLFVILVIFFAYGRDILRLVLVFFQKNLFDFLPFKYHKWFNLGMGLTTVILLIFFLVQMYEISRLRGVYYYKLHRESYEQRVFERIQQLEYTGYTERSLMLYLNLKEFSTTPEIYAKVISKLNQLKASLLLSNRYYAKFEQSEEPLSLQRMEWLMMSRWLNPENSEIAASYDQRLVSLEDADQQLDEFWDAAKAKDTSAVRRIMDQHGWYISYYHQPDWFSDKGLVITRLMEKIGQTQEKLEFINEVHTYWDLINFQKSREYLASLEQGELVRGSFVFDQRAYQRYRMDGNKFALHTIEPGDNLTTIARKYRISRSKLILENLLDNPDKIYPDDNLLIPIRAYLRLKSRIETITNTPFGNEDRIPVIGEN